MFLWIIAASALHCPLEELQLEHAPLVDSRDGGALPAADFMDAILYELLNAQVVWLATRDPASLRRKLIEILAPLG
ncbi:MAG TPA: hypothetical protein VNO30_00930 [Kofleriaceae bacterium]|nr:hypothetical protein [Kofleriaceae bacterium]